MNHQGTKAQIEPIPKETDEIATKIVDAVYTVHTKLGLGLLKASMRLACCANSRSGG
jgi:hypothetical protein